MGSLVGRPLQHLKEVGDEAGQEKEKAVRVERSRAVTEVVEKGVVRLRLGLRLPERPRVRTRIVKEKEVLKWPLVVRTFHGSGRLYHCAELRNRR